MAMTNWSGPINVTNGYITPVTYIHATDIDNNGEVKIEAGANVVILSPADGGPAVTVKLVLPLVDTINSQTFNEYNADPYFDGIRGSVLNYGAVDHILIGADDGNQNQPVNGSTTGVDILQGTIVQWGGNGNPTAPWAAITSNLATPV